MKKGLDFSRPFTYLTPRPGLVTGTYGLTDTILTPASPFFAHTYTDWQ
jgi:hypothetical protein